MWIKCADIGRCESYIRKFFLLTDQIKMEIMKKNFGFENRDQN